MTADNTSPPDLLAALKASLRTRAVTDAPDLDAAMRNLTTARHTAFMNPGMLWARQMERVCGDAADLVAALREAEAKLAAIQGHFDHVYAEDDEGEYGNIPDIYDPDFYRGLDFGLRPIRAILDIAEGS